ncbi:rhodanese-like domain-containing protein [Sulfurovum sp. TSL1]|uniref:rhodanese-like domain-containing protein n=1 Tax=Sulfurovum sp. TSL1 TaxID=2826994 RepID=UPI001CC4EC60|nr:rhodanese-like domain-containing protein [Sulfurovum sp. TSL1]GIT97635.1 hypothetical protein TSL1_04560 [Sulfurovum sp. TSL1]
MFYKMTMFSLFLTVFIIAGEHGFEYEGVAVKTVDTDGKIKQVVVKREIPEVCKEVPLNNEMLWTGNYANAKVPEACKSTYVSTKGKLLPMQLHEDIDTYGELEVLAFIKEMQENDSMILVDGRKQDWYEYRTIPGAVNMPFYHLKERQSYEFEFEHDIRTLGVKINEDDSLDFTKAKTVAVFCNGPWCSQSVAMIIALLEIGYPTEKIKWYRGGMQAWLAAGMVSTRK